MGQAAGGSSVILRSEEACCTPFPPDSCECLIWLSRPYMPLYRQQAARVPAPSTSDGGAAAAVAASLVASKKSMAERAVGGAPSRSPSSPSPFPPPPECQLEAQLLSSHRPCPKCPLSSFLPSVSLVDVLTGWKALIVTGLFLPFILSFVYLILLRFFAGPMVYATVILVNLAAIGGTLYCFSKAGLIAENSLSEVASVSGGSLQYNATAANLAYGQAANASAAYNAQSQQLNFNTSSSAYSSIQDLAHDQSLQMYYLGIACAVLTAVLFLATIVMIPRLKVAIATIKVSSIFPD